MSISLKIPNNISNNNNSSPSCSAYHIPSTVLRALLALTYSIFNPQSIWGKQYYPTFNRRGT